MDFAAALLAENRAFGGLVEGGDPAQPIPTCPEWNLKQLFRHVGRGHLWAAQIVADRRDQPPDPRAVAGGKPPDDPGAATDWLNAGAQRVIDTVVNTGAETPVWTFLGPRPAGWWIRRRLHEVVVHRADAALALGRDFDVTPELAADGVSEWLGLITAGIRRGGGPPLGTGQSLHLHATDPGLGPAGEWTVQAGPDGLSWSHEHGKGAVAVRGTASRLLLALLRRIPAEDAGITIFGDSAVWHAWLGRTPF